MISNLIISLWTIMYSDWLKFNNGSLMFSREDFSTIIITEKLGILYMLQKCISCTYCLNFSHLWFFVSFRIIFFRTTQELEYFFLSRRARTFFPEFNIRLYDILLNLRSSPRLKLYKLPNNEVILTLTPVGQSDIM
jgi:hypothetical protein